MNGYDLFRKTMVLFFIFLFVMASILPLAKCITSHNNNFETCNLDGNILFVGGIGPGNYTNIQDAINVASDDDTIFVYNGTYYENVIVDKIIDLIGENKGTTIIDGMIRGDTITINVEGVTLSNFTITNGATNKKTDVCRAGIRITSSNNNIKNNIIKNNKMGIFGLRVTNLAICNNQFYDDGITFSPYENEGRPKIFVKYFLHNIYNNTVNDKPLYYYKNQHDFIVPSDAGQVMLVNCANATIANAELTNSDNGLLLAYCSNCIVEHSNISNSDGIWTFRSNQNIFQFNNLSNNFHGITLDYSSNDNVIKNNTISNNEFVGVMIEYYSKNNLIKHNTIIKNNFSNAHQMQAYINKWKENYWDDWIGLKHNSLKCFPKIIRGCPIEKIPIPLWTNFDWHPAEVPYEL